MTEPVTYGKYYSDSLFMPPEPEHIVPSFITGGFNKAIEPLERVTTDLMNGWDYGILAALLLIIIVNKQLYPRQFQQIFSVFKGVSPTNQLLREWTPIQSFINFSLQLCFAIVLSLFVQKSLVVLTHSAEYNEIVPFLIILLIVVSATVLRYIVMYSVEKLFNCHDVFDRQTAVDLAVKTSMLIVMIPVTLVLIYIPRNNIVMTGIWIAFVMLLLRGIYEFVETRVFSKLSSFYIFLYLCSLEIIPAVVVAVACYRLLESGSTL